MRRPSLSAGNRSMPSMLATALAVSLAASACASGTVEPELTPPRSFPGFPATAWLGLVNAEAVFDTRHEETFDTDLIADGVLPIQLTIGLRGRDQEYAQIRLDPELTDMRLYLPDGQVLAPVSADVAASDQERGTRARLRDLALEPGVLPTLDAARERPRYAYFRLPRRDARVSGSRLLLGGKGPVRVVEVTQALISFNVMFENELRPFYVGIRR